MRQRSFLFLILLPLSLSALALGYYGFAIVPGERAEAILREARSSIAGNQLEPARAQLAKAMQYRQTRTRAALQLFDLLFLSQPERAREILEGVQETEGKTVDVIAREVALSGGKLEPETLRKVKEVLEKDSQFMSLYALLLIHIQQNAGDKSGQILSDLRQDFAGQTLSVLVTGQVLLMQQGSLDRVAGKQQLMSLLTPPSEAAFSAALSLLKAPGAVLFPADRRDIGQALLAHPWLEETVGNLSSGNLEVLVSALAADAPRAAFRFSEARLLRPETAARHRILHLELASRLNLQEPVADLVEDMRQMPGLSPEEALTLVRFSFETGRYEAGLQGLQTVLRAHPGDPSSFRLLALYSSDRAERLPLETRIQVLKFLADHSLASPEAALSAFNSLISQDPGERSRYLDQAVERFRESHPVLLAEWLNVNNAYAETLEVVPDAMARSDPAAFSARMDALVGERMIEPARALASSAAEMLDPTARSLTMARIHHMDGEKALAEDALKKAVQSSIDEEQANLLISLGMIAAELAYRDLQQLAFDHAFHLGAVFPDRAAVTYLRQLLSSNRIAAAEEFSAYCRSLSPDNPLHVNNDCYVQIIQQKNIPESVAAMQAVVTQNPGINVYRGTLALAHLLNDEPRTALNVLEQRQTQANPQSSQQTMILALILAGNDQTGLAENMVAELDQDQLNASEIELLRAHGLIHSED